MIFDLKVETMTVDEELMLNRVLDRYGEAMRANLRPEILVRFDALTPDARRALVVKKLIQGEQDE
jgi:hypothetical protein